MASEASKARARVIGLLSGKGIDIGCGDDPITPDCDKWDLPEGDAMLMQGVPNNMYDWVFSSHCLEHMNDPGLALWHWWRILKVGGVLVFLVPDEDLYEQGVWPSTWNGDHKHTFTACKSHSWSPVSLSIPQLLEPLQDHKLWSLRTLDYGYEYGQARRDQSQGEAEVAVEVIVQKVHPKPFNPLTHLHSMYVCERCGAEPWLLGGQIPLDRVCGLCRGGLG